MPCAFENTSQKMWTCTLSLWLKVTCLEMVTLAASTQSSFILSHFDEYSVSMVFQLIYPVQASCISIFPLFVLGCIIPKGSNSTDIWLSEDLLGSFCLVHWGWCRPILSPFISHTAPSKFCLTGNSESNHSFRRFAGLLSCCSNSSEACWRLNTPLLPFYRELTPLPPCILLFGNCPCKMHNLFENNQLCQNITKIMDWNVSLVIWICFDWFRCLIIALVVTRFQQGFVF